MQSNKLRTAIKATTAVLVLGVAGQASAANFSAGEYDMSVYGYARLNASYDIDEEVGISTRSGAYSAINTTDADEPTGVFGADAVQTRIGVKTTTPEGVNITVEGDFRGGTLRLRHGFGEYNGVLMGQTWSNFNSFVGNTSTLDFDSLPGLAGLQGRVAQARYTTGPLSFSLEQPNNFVLDSGGIEKDGMPALTARLEDSQGGFSYAAAVLAHQVGIDDGTVDESTFGFATFGAAKIALSDMFTIQGTVSYTDGANSYLYRSGDNFGAASAYLSGGDLETISGYGASVGTGISLGGGRSVNIGYGLATVDWDDAEADLGAAAVADESETNSAIMANYQWTPVNNVMMGVEYQLLSRENVDGSDGDASRVLFAAQYNF
ncbi:DcaP family trimeric outer membrane transporter [Marinobacter sp. F4216]|uniref:DcaP family trimeric outer membrane transporter n=1 Tax=Marinobacter sp. F4216 TaxID=2874281 RepID=UPI001CBDF889|nr:DcaP family trimeric outer membrane transporter [Marinobacter sp. F4216]MBZ2168981.1 hypothetical protein [Marinobacter sp. F4216]